MIIRLATAEDLAVIDDIYNHYVHTSTCTYQTEPGTLGERHAWFARHDAAHPVTVGTVDGEVIAWGSLSWFREREGYRNTVENSVYVRHDLHGRGHGRALLVDLIARARALGHRTMLALIDGEQTPSITLHERLGFVAAGRVREAGRKFDRWLDLVLMQLPLEKD